MTAEHESARPRVDRAVLLAAGRGSRLRPHTDTVPKPLLPWRGRPTLDHLVDALEAAGIRRIVLVTGHLAGAIDGWAAARVAAATGAGPAGPADGPRRAALSTVRQASLGGTADALAAAAAADPDVVADRFVLAATDYLVGPAFVEGFLAFDAAHGAGASVSLKRLGADGAARSSARFDGRAPVRDGDGAEVLEVVEKPAPGAAPSEIGANLAFVLPPAVAARARDVAPSARGEREVQSALNAWLAGGGRCRGLLQPTPAEWTPPA